MAILRYSLQKKEKIFEKLFLWQVGIPRILHILVTYLLYAIYSITLRFQEICSIILHVCKIWFWTDWNNSLWIVLPKFQVSQCLWDKFRLNRFRLSIVINKTHRKDERSTLYMAEEIWIGHSLPKLIAKCKRNNCFDCYVQTLPSTILWTYRISSNKPPEGLFFQPPSEGGLLEGGLNI